MLNPLTMCLFPSYFCWLVANNTRSPSATLWVTWVKEHSGFPPTECFYPEDRLILLVHTYFRAPGPLCEWSLTFAAYHAARDRRGSQCVCVCVGGVGGREQLHVVVVVVAAVCRDGCTHMHGWCWLLMSARVILTLTLLMSPDLLLLSATLGHS